MSTLTISEKRKIKVLFLIHDLGQGGAEKVLVSLVNHLDLTIFSVSVIALFAGGVNEHLLKKDIRYKWIFPKEFRGNIHLFKLLSPEKLHRLIVKEKYDIEISYLEGPSARVISGCPYKQTRLIAWIHSTQSSMHQLSRSFRSNQEAIRCYERFDQIACVSDNVMKSFCELTGRKNNVCVVYNTVESDLIRKKAEEQLNPEYDPSTVNLIAVGTLKPVKGYFRLLNIIEKLYKEDYKIHLYLLGDGPQKNEMEDFLEKHDLSGAVTLMGFQRNPYKYVSNADLFICSSYSEGFSTAVTEALIVGTPVITTDVSGMKELLGSQNEYGIITENSDEALYYGIKELLDNSEQIKYYADKAEERGRMFNTDATVKKVQSMLLDAVTQK